jgi:hypothetical protein
VEIYRGVQDLIEIWLKYRALYMNIYVRFIISGNLKSPLKRYIRVK